MSTSTALVVIDVQVGLMEEAYRRDETLRTINRLLERARESGTPVIYVQHDGPKGHGLEAGTPDWHIHPTIAPRADEPVVNKTASDSFHQTRLQAELEARGIKHLVIMGGQTDYCVNATACRALYVGYDVTLVSDAHTTYDNGTLTAPQIIAYFNEALNGYEVDGHELHVRAADEVSFKTEGHARI